MLRKTSAPHLVVFGEFFFDLVFYRLPEPPRVGAEVRTDHFVEAAGGGLSTTAMVAASLGTPTAVVTRLGTDAPLHASWQKLLKLGIRTDACEFRKDFSTALTVCVALQGDRMMITHDSINARLDDLLMQPKVRRALLSARHVHFAFAFRSPERYLGLLDQLRSRGVTLSADIGWNPDVLGSKKIVRVLRRLDLFFPNEDEARTLTGESSAQKAAHQLARWVQTPVVKLGARGSLAVADGKVLRAPSRPVRVVDATGAGDAFDGGFLHAYLRGSPWLDCLRAGNICGAIAIGAPSGTGVLPKPRGLRNLHSPGNKTREVS
jgi:sugar/nucleoside kinase (ribokinase family)